MTSRTIRPRLTATYKLTTDRGIKVRIMCQPAECPCLGDFLGAVGVVRQIEQVS